MTMTDRQLEQVQKNMTPNVPKMERIGASIQEILDKQGLFDPEAAEKAKVEAENRRIHYAINASGVPERHRQRREWSEPRWMEKGKSIWGMLDTGCLVAIIGDRGTGKSQMGVELIRKKCINEKSPSVLYVWLTEIFMSIRRSYNDDDVDEMGQISEFLRTRLLVIDEAHERGETAWENRMLAYIVDKRYASMADTIIISNHNQQGFKEAFGESIYSRLIETGAIVNCDWPSFRAAPTS